MIDKIRRYLTQLQEQEGDLLYLDESGFKEEKQEDHSKASNSSHLKETSDPKVQLSNEPEKLLMTQNAIEPNWKDSTSIEELFSSIHNCRSCPLGSTRTKFVFGTGNPNADIMIIGEAPGRDEDLQGKPFVGRAGQLLTRILEAINLSRDEVFIANILKCRPPGNRKPEPPEVEQCEPYLMKQIELIKPAFILTLGLTALDTLLKGKHKMGEMRGQVLDYCGTKMIVTYHPAALLRNPNWKKLAWEDVKKLRKMYDDYLTDQGK